MAPTVHSSPSRPALRACCPSKRRKGGRFVETPAPTGKSSRSAGCGCGSPLSDWCFPGVRRPSPPIRRPRWRCSFEPVGAETRVMVEHRGWDTVPAAHVARHGMAHTLFLRRHGEWWQTLLDSLKTSMARLERRRGQRVTASTMDEDGRSRPRAHRRVRLHLRVGADEFGLVRHHDPDPAQPDQADGAWRHSQRRRNGIRCSPRPGG